MAVKDVLMAVENRVKAPYFGYTALAFLAINWKSILLLALSEKSIESKVLIFERSTDIYNLLLMPLTIGIITAATMPWIGYAFQFISRKPATLSAELSQDAEHRSLVRKKELERTLADLSADRERELIERAKRDEEIGSIESDEARKKLELELERTRKERDKLLIKRSEEQNSKLATEYKEAIEMVENYRRLKDKAMLDMDLNTSKKHEHEMYRWKKQLKRIENRLSTGGF